MASCALPLATTELPYAKAAPLYNSPAASPIIPPLVPQMFPMPPAAQPTPPPHHQSPSAPTTPHSSAMLGGTHATYIRSAWVAPNHESGVLCSTSRRPRRSIGSVSPARTFRAVLSGAPPPPALPPPQLPRQYRNKPVCSRSTQAASAPPARNTLDRPHPHRAPARTSPAPASKDSRPIARSADANPRPLKFRELHRSSDHRDCRSLPRPQHRARRRKQQP